MPISLLPQTQMYSHTKLYATDLVDLEYCPRLFYMKKTMKIPRTETFPMLRGTIEHEVRRTTIKSLKEEYKSCDNLPLLKHLDYKLSIHNAINYGLDLGRKVSPKFYLGLDKMIPFLRYRLEMEEETRHSQAILMATKGYEMKDIIETLLPWRLEHGVGSTKLGITGRVDQVYKIKGNIIPLDFKTHTNRFATFIWEPAHFEQLAVYALLLENNNPGYKVKNGIIKYTEDLHDKKFKITKQNKINVIQHIKKARNLLDDGKLPTKLDGKKTVKCSCCYLREFCFSIKDGGESNC